MMTRMNYQGKGRKKTNNIKEAISTKYCCEHKCRKPCMLISANHYRLLSLHATTYKFSFTNAQHSHPYEEDFCPFENLLFYSMLVQLLGKKRVCRGGQKWSSKYCSQCCLRDNTLLRDNNWCFYDGESYLKNYFTNVNKSGGNLILWDKRTRI